MLNNRLSILVASLVLIASQSAVRAEDSPSQQWTALMDAGKKAAEQRHNADAEAAFNKALEQAEKLGPKDEKIDTTLTHLTNLYMAENKFAQAEAVCKRQIQFLENENSLDVGQVMGNLAMIYHFEGKDDLVEPLLQKAITMVEAAKPGNVELSKLITKLAVFYMGHNNTAGAEKILQEATAIDEKNGDEKTLANDFTNMATLRLKQNKPNDAEALLKRALQIREKTVNGDYADTLASLGVFYIENGRPADAEPLYKQVITVFEKVDGPNSLSAALPLHNLAVCYIAQQRRNQD